VPSSRNREEGNAALPPEPADPVDLRLLRTEDLLVAQLRAPGCHVEPGEPGQRGPELVADTDPASLVLELPPQHLGEHSWQEADTPVGLAAHRAAAPSRVVFALTVGARIPFTLEGILAVLPTLPLRVAGHATPADPTRRLDVSWTDAILVRGWERLLDRADAAGQAADLGDLVFGVDRPDTLRGSALSDSAARVLQRAQAGRLVGSLNRPVSVVSDLARDEAGLGRGRAGGHTGIVLRPGRIGPIVRPKRGPRPPTDLETSIEAPYRLQVSPSRFGAFTHDPAPTRSPVDPGRTELWRTHLTVRTEDRDGTFTGLDDTDDTQRIVRAVWSRDMDQADAGAAKDPPGLAPQSLNPPQRRGIVRQTSDVRLPKPPRPLDVRALSLSSLGAFLDWRGGWLTDEVTTPTNPAPPGFQLISSYRHQVVMGRDQYVWVANPGHLHPFGHRADWVTLTERKVKDRSDAVAALSQRHFILRKQRALTYDGHDSPYTQVVIEPIVTPDLDPHDDLDNPWVPTRGGVPFAFTVIGTDRSGMTWTHPAPLVWVPDQAYDAADEKATIQARVEAAYAPVAQIPGLGQKIAFATPATAGDTAFEVNRLVFRGVVDTARFTSRPSLSRFNAVVPAMRHLSPQAPGVDLVYAKAFLDDANGFGAGNPSELLLALAGPPPAVDFSGGSDRSGGFLTPNLLVRGVSRSLGAVGEDGTGPSGLSQGKFDAKAFLDGALPKLFGLFSLVDLLDAAGLDLSKAPEFVTEALDTVSAVVSEADRLRTAALAVGPRLDEEIARAAHDGARNALTALKAQMDAVTGPLVTDLLELVDAVADLPGGTLPAAADRVTSALVQVAADIDGLLGALGSPQLPAAVRATLDRPATALATLAAAAETIKAVTDFAQNLLSPGTAVTARFEWRPVLRSFPPGAEVIIIKQPEKSLRLAVEVRASATTPPKVDVVAELTEFGLQLMPGAPLMGLAFSRIGFRVASGGKPEVDVVFDGIEFLGPLSFIDTLRRMIPFDGFADPPFVDVSPEGVTAGFDLALPNVSVGVFSLENIALGADARVPFLGDAVTVGFYFCTKESPFRLTVMCIGGGGWVGLRASPKGLVLLEMGLEACACLSVDLGVASGSVSISVGVYLRLEADKGLLTAYFRIRGEVDVLGLISASITLELSLTYHFETGKLIGRASLVVEVEVLFFSASVEITVERKLAGSKGDPVFRDVLPPAPDGTNADWSRYCEAFAPVPFA
jgi:hypothetical protein